MDHSLLTLVVSSGAASERRDACEFLDLKTRIEEERYRQLSADLDKKRIRNYNAHLEEQRKVEKELDLLQKDRLRFEREKQLRKRKCFSTSRGRKQSTKSLGKDGKITLPMNEDALGGSASIAFDPKVKKYRRRRRKAKTETSISNFRKAEDEITDTTNFPYLSEGEVKRFHQSCKSAAKSAECRRWGAAWLYAKKEQDRVMNKSERWTSLLLNAEKEKMRALCEKLIGSSERKLPEVILECWTEPDKSTPVRVTRGKETVKPGQDIEKKELLKGDQENANNKVVTEAFEEHDENTGKNGLKTSREQSSNFSLTKQEGLVGKDSSIRSIMVGNEFPFVSPFSKGMSIPNKLSFHRESPSKVCSLSRISKNKEEEEDGSKQKKLLKNVTSELLQQKNETGHRGSVSFLPGI